jgi:hypothetical protein
LLSQIADIVGMTLVFTGKNGDFEMPSHIHPEIRENYDLCNEIQRTGIAP